MGMLSDFDLVPQHQAGVRLDVLHACPECPSPLAAGLTIGPSPWCPYCHGSGTLTAAELARWQATVDARARATRR